MDGRATPLRHRLHYLTIDRGGRTRTGNYRYPKAVGYLSPTPRNLGGRLRSGGLVLPEHALFHAELHLEARVVAHRPGALLRGVRHVPCSPVIRRAAAVVMASSRCATLGGPFGLRRGDAIATDGVEPPSAARMRGMPDRQVRRVMIRRLSRRPACSFR